jgi:hypothetical protein
LPRGVRAMSVLNDSSSMVSNGWYLRMLIDGERNDNLFGVSCILAYAMQSEG